MIREINWAPEQRGSEDPISHWLINKIETESRQTSTPMRRPQPLGLVLQNQAHTHCTHFIQEAILHLIHLLFKMRDCSFGELAPNDVCLMCAALTLKSSWTNTLSHTSCWGESVPVLLQKTVWFIIFGTGRIPEDQEWFVLVRIWVRIQIV